MRNSTNCHPNQYAIVLNINADIIVLDIHLFWKAVADPMTTPMPSSSHTPLLSNRRDRTLPQSIRRLVWLASLSLTMSMSLGLPLAGQAQAPRSIEQTLAQAAPNELTQLLTNLDAAANQQNSQAIAEFFSPNFTHSDGLTLKTLQDALSNLWERYPKLTYRTELKSWKREGTAIVAETITYINGVQTEGEREFKLDSTLEARQRIENQKIIQQEILNERSQITSGANPPTLKISLPAQVRAGQEFTFDAIVQEPLGDDLLMGVAVEEPISPEGLLNSTTVDLEQLPSGGIFKVGRAPDKAVPHWLSAVIVRHDGITMVTQRLRIEGRR